MQSEREFPTLRNGNVSAVHAVVSPDNAKPAMGTKPVDKQVIMDVKNESTASSATGSSAPRTATEEVSRSNKAAHTKKAKRKSKNVLSRKQAAGFVRVPRAASALFSRDVINTIYSPTNYRRSCC